MRGTADGILARAVRRRVPRWGVVVTATLAACGLATPGYAADDGVLGPVGPNPNNRGYELAMPADTGGNVPQFALTSTDPDRLVIGIQGGVADSTSGVVSAFLGQRGLAGWRFTNILPPAAVMADSSWAGLARTPDLSSLLITTFSGFGAVAPGSVIRLEPGGSPSVLDPPGDSEAVGWATGSDDLKHVFVRTLAARVPDDTNDRYDAYALGTGQVELMSRLTGNGPGGADDPVAPCGANAPQDGFTSGFLESAQLYASQHWVSGDGRRVLFGSQRSLTSPPTPPQCQGPNKLYVRDRHDLSDPDDDETIDIDPVGASGDDLDSYFVRASADLRQIVFVTRGRLDVVEGPADTNLSADIYRHTLGHGNECLTCVAGQVDVDWSFNNGFIDTVAVAEDLSRVYFISRRLLAPGGRDGETNLYVLRRGQVSFVAPTPFVTNHLARGGQLTPDGRVVVFRSNDPRLDTATNSTNGGFFQYYRYNDEAPAGQRLVCMSCATEPTADVERELIYNSGRSFAAVGEEKGALSDDGRVFAFISPDRLHPHDINGTPDVYEWSDGELTLLTDGRTDTSDLDILKLMGVSEDGVNILFAANAELIPGTAEGLVTLYNARRDGGFAMRSEVEVPPCEGDRCQGDLSGPPSLLDASTGTRRPAPSDPPEPRLSVERITRAQRSRLARTGKLALRVEVSAPGDVVVTATTRIKRRARTVARAERTFAESGRARIELILSRLARNRLAQTKRLRVRISLDYSELAAPRTLTLSLRSSGRAKRPAAKKAGGKANR